MRSFANGSLASLPRTRCAASSSRVSGSRRGEASLAITLLDSAALSFPGAPPTETPINDPILEDARRAAVGGRAPCARTHAAGPAPASPRSDHAADALRRALCAPRYAVALGLRDDDWPVSPVDATRQLCVVREIPALRLQLQRREPVPDDQGVLSGRL